MGSRHPSQNRQGRTWRQSAGAALSATGPGVPDSIGAFGLIRRPPPGFDPENPNGDAAAGEPREPWALKTTDTLRPGERGTKRLVAEFGDRLVCVRYRCDPANRKRYKTVELVVAEAAWEPPPGPDDVVRVRVAFAEEELRQRVKEAGGRWRPETKTWELPRRTAEELGLAGRIVAG